MVLSAFCVFLFEGQTKIHGLFCTDRGGPIILQIECLLNPLKLNLISSTIALPRAIIRLIKVESFEGLFKGIQFEG